MLTSQRLQKVFDTGTIIQGHDFSYIPLDVWRLVESAKDAVPQHKARTHRCFEVTAMKGISGDHVFKTVIYHRPDWGSLFYDIHVLNVCKFDFDR